MASATLSIDTAALRANYQLLRARHAKKNIAAVVKANAYGLGMPEVAKILAGEGCPLFFVATLEEAIELRGVLPEAKIAVFNGIDASEKKEFTHHRLMPVINDLSQLALAGEHYILHIDTGMTRLGLSESDVKKMSALPHAPKFIMSHLSCGNDASHPKNAEQLARLKTVIPYFPTIPVSFANSSGLFLADDFHFDLGRPGCAIYGINPVMGSNPMRHVATLSAPILQIRTLDRDEQVGYGGTYDAPQNSRLAIVGMGYSDGYFRSLSNRGVAYFNGYKVPIAGRVSMDMIALDVSRIPEGKLGHAMRAEFINEKQPVDVIADQCDTAAYEVFTRIGRRVKRVYR